MKSYLYAFNPFRNPCLPNWIWFEYQPAKTPGYWDHDVIAVYYLEWYAKKVRRKCSVLWGVKEWTIAEILQQVGAYLPSSFSVETANYFIEYGLPLGEFAVPLVIMEHPPGDKQIEHC